VGEVAAGAGAHRETVEVDAVVDDRGDRNVTGGGGLRAGDGDDRHAAGDCPVDVGALGIERPVIGRDHLQAWEPLGVHRAHHRVVVHNVMALHRLVRVQHVPQLPRSHTQVPTRRAGVHRRPRYWTRRVAGGEQQHLMADGGETTGQPVHHRLGAAIARRWHRQPGRGDQRDPHTGVVA
jgi:hypothetical protein